IRARRQWIVDRHARPGEIAGPHCCSWYGQCAHPDCACVIPLLRSPEKRLVLLDRSAERTAPEPVIEIRSRDGATVREKVIRRRGGSCYPAEERRQATEASSWFDPAGAHKTDCLCGRRLESEART